MDFNFDLDMSAFDAAIADTSEKTQSNIVDNSPIDYVKTNGILIENLRVKYANKPAIGKNQNDIQTIDNKIYGTQAVTIYEQIIEENFNLDMQTVMVNNAMITIKYIYPNNDKAENIYDLTSNYSIATVTLIYPNYDTFIVDKKASIKKLKNQSESKGKLSVIDKDSYEQSIEYLRNYRQATKKIMTSSSVTFTEDFEVVKENYATYILHRERVRRLRDLLEYPHDGGYVSKSKPTKTKLSQGNTVSLPLSINKITSPFFVLKSESGIFSLELTNNGNIYLRRHSPSNERSIIASFIIATISGYELITKQRKEGSAYTTRQVTYKPYKPDIEVNTKTIDNSKWLLIEGIPSKIFKLINNDNCKEFLRDAYLNSKTLDKLDRPGKNARKKALKKANATKKIIDLISVEIPPKYKLVEE